MNLDVEALAKEIAPVFKSYVTTAIEPLLARIAELEAREPIHGKDGIQGDKGEQGIPGSSGERGEAGPEGPQGPQGEKGEAGQSISTEDLAPLIAGAVAKALESSGEAFVAKAAERAAALVPAPQDGRDGEPGPAGEKGDAGAPGNRGAEGPEGKSGRDGRDGLPGVQGEKGLNGKDGRDGVDGFGFDDMSVEFDGERTATLKFAQGERTEEFPLVFRGTTIYRGVFQPERKYETGDQVTFGGSTWTAMRETEAEKPDGSNDAWLLSAKRGRDGKFFDKDNPAPPAVVRFR